MPRSDAGFRVVTARAERVRHRRLVGGSCVRRARAHLAVPAPTVRYAGVFGRASKARSKLRGLMPARDAEPLGRARGAGVPWAELLRPGVRHRRARVPARRPSQRGSHRRGFRHGARGARGPRAPVHPGDPSRLRGARRRPSSGSTTLRSPAQRRHDSAGTGLRGRRPNVCALT